MWQQYFTPDTLEGALQLLAAHQDDARIIAGGTDLLLELERGQRPGISTLIDISRIPGLDRIDLAEDGWIHLGPMVTHNHCAHSALLVEQAFGLAKACWEVGAPQIRNRGTIAGNLITASPANDSISPLMALGARVTLSSLRGERELPLEDFYTGVRRTVMESDELLVDIAIPPSPYERKSHFIKLALRRAQAISIVNVAAVLGMEGEEIRQAAITLGAVAPTVIHAEKAAQVLIGEQLSEAVITRAGDAAVEAAQPINDLRGSAAYRREMVRVCTRRALSELAAGSAREGFPAKPITLWGPGEWRWTQNLPETYQHEAGSPIHTKINGKSYTFSSGQNKTLLRLLREEAGLIGTKEGCAEGECGACTVFLDGMAVMACLVPAPRAHAAEVETIEGLAKDGELHPLQEAFIQEGAVQCGYCTPGLIMSGVKLLEECAQPTQSEIQQSITGNLCRCTGYYKILSAIEKAAGR